METMKRSAAVCVGWWGGEMNGQSPEKFEGSENTLEDIMMDRCHYIFVLIHRMCNIKNKPLGRLLMLGS